MLGATESKIGFKMWTHLASCFGLTTSMDSILATQQKALYVYGEIVVRFWASSFLGFDSQPVPFGHSTTSHDLS
ncbi:predicted protein [Lichtheimia corymbifera JMRC:FSU:9682]|uniref:Uncharacterized protein n=1 Tax=Lichtheimia corymbifera JMRC:FSU:9682 TaxID=1263082 RepID=A0A068RJF6_9FUNG|nr:predicted protein [Lichtheimia corymbifera JMRC:FSU:9682]